MTSQNVEVDFFIMKLRLWDTASNILIWRVFFLLWYRPGRCDAYLRCKVRRGFDCSARVAEIKSTIFTILFATESLTLNNNDSENI